MNKKSKLITALVVLFLTGVITGITGTRIAYRNMMPKFSKGHQFFRNGSKLTSANSLYRSNKTKKSLRS